MDKREIMDDASTIDAAEIAAILQGLPYEIRRDIFHFVKGAEYMVHSKALEVQYIGDSQGKGTEKRRGTMNL